MIGKNYFINLFFQPDREDWGNPSVYGVNYEEVSFPSNSYFLHGYYLKPRSRQRAVVLHCHGNAGNVTSHFPLLLFLVHAGYGVLSFDYRGYGRSQGSPTPEGIVEDALAALAYLRSRADVDPSRMALLGQSLGGAAASGAMRKDPTVRCLILDATFTTYRQMATATNLGKILFLIIPFVIPEMGPLLDLPDISPRPVLLIHGENDKVVPPSMSKKLFDAKGENKRLLIIKKAGHLHKCQDSEEYQKAVLQFLEESIPS